MAQRTTPTARDGVFYEHGEFAVYRRGEIVGYRATRIEADELDAETRVQRARLEGQGQQGR